MKHNNISSVTKAIQTYLFALTAEESKSMQKAAVSKQKVYVKKSFAPLSK